MRSFEQLIEMVRRLRAECPWDRKQTVASTRPLVLNEAYELDAALASGEPTDIGEELGDYLFMGVFLAELVRTDHDIAMETILEGVIAKLKRRHPHIYGGLEVRDAEQVLENWDRIKREEHKGAGQRESVLDGLPQALPALKQSGLMQERCRRAGFRWANPEDVLDKVAEEIAELRAETAGGEMNRARTAEELGDLFFALVGLARSLGIDAENSLRDANTKFGHRFRQVEQEFRRRGTSLKEATPAEIEMVWRQVKQQSAVDIKTDSG